MARKGEDTKLREYLKRETDEIDKEIINNIEDVVDDICYHADDFLPNLSDHCYFTVEKFTSIIRQVLYRRVRRNNLKVRLAEQSKMKYVSKIVNEVEEKYIGLQAMAKNTRCGNELYPPFSVIQKDVIDYVERFFNEAQRYEIEGIEKKIALYEKYADKFSLKDVKKTSIDEPLEKNRAYLKGLKEIR